MPRKSLAYWFLQAFDRAIVTDRLPPPSLLVCKALKASGQQKVLASILAGEECNFTSGPLLLDPQKAALLR